MAFADIIFGTITCRFLFDLPEDFLNDALLEFTVIHTLPKLISLLLGYRANVLRVKAQTYTFANGRIGAPLAQEVSLLTK